MTKKKVIAYLHSHWDREWYREFEVFRMRLLRVFDEVLSMLQSDKIPCFYFDGQTSALQDYLEINPDKLTLVKKLIMQKKLFIGPCYTLVDEFLTDRVCFRKNLEIGIKYSQSLGCKDFIGYFADTFGHSKNVPEILKEFGIDKAIVWRGCGGEIPSEFTFNGVKTVNLIRGYFNDVFSSELSIEKKAGFLKEHLDKIAKKSKNAILMPIGADHLGVEFDIKEQIASVNKKLVDYEIKLSSPFEYFELVKDNFKKFEHNGELRDNSQTFILQGCYSSRIKLKQYNVMCSHKLDLANKFQLLTQKKYKTKSYDNLVEYAYKLLLQNQAHDGICGCSIDSVHKENISRYEKILQIADNILEELKFEIGKKPLIGNMSNEIFNGIIEFESPDKFPDDVVQLLSKRDGFEQKLLLNTHKIPVTEDYKPIYKYLIQLENKPPSRLLSKANNLKLGIPSLTDLKVTENSIENSKVRLTVKDGEIGYYNKETLEAHTNIFEFIDYTDCGDTYNFGPDKNDVGILGEIISSKILRKGHLQSALLLKIKVAKSILNVEISLNKLSHLFNLKIDWDNKTENHLLRIKFNLDEKITKTYSEDMNTLIERTFDPDYDIRKNLPNEIGLEAKTNTAPMQRYVFTNGLEIVTKGLCEYEVKENSLSITLLRAIGIISNPLNPARTTPAGPPIKVPEAQQLGKNSVELSFGFGNVEDWEKTVNEVFQQIVLNY